MSTAEQERLAAVRRYDVLDTPPDGAFDRITALAAKHFDVPIAIVSIVDSDRIWFKSHHGLPDLGQIGREPGLCASAIMHDEPWVVQNASEDPRALANPLVAGEFGLRFYAGAPLMTADGHRLGTLCVIDREPRVFSADQTDTLRDLAAIVMDELELRLAAQRTIDHEQELRDHAELTARALQESLLPPELPRIDGAEVAALYLPAEASTVGGDFYDVFPLGAAGDDRWALVVGDVSGKGPSAAAVTALTRHTIRAAALSARSPADTLATLNEALFVGRDETNMPPHYCTALVIFAQRSPEGFTITVSAAGHPPPIVFRAGRAEELDIRGAPAGWYRGVSFGDAGAELHPGDLLLAYTDGLTEARTPGGLLGVAGLLDILEPRGNEPACELIERLRAGLSRQDLRVRDDVAALALSL